MCTGTILEELGKLTALGRLSLSNNNLSGEQTGKYRFDSTRYTKYYGFARRLLEDLSCQRVGGTHLLEAPVLESGESETNFLT